MVRDRFKLMALEVHEAGKGWVEADGDITEAIDFCRYYAENIVEFDKPQKIGYVPGEVNLYSYHPRGVALVIAPWNFPLAILAGMTVAAAIKITRIHPANLTPGERSTAIRCHQRTGIQATSKAKSGKMTRANHCQIG